MKTNKKLTDIYNSSKRIKISDDSKIVIMSDVHRGNGENYDNFLKNKNIFNAALLQYFNKGYTYIELGDGDELWEVKNYKEIVDIHINTFNIIKKFHDDNRFIMIYGNHDFHKNDPEFIKDFYDSHNGEFLLKDLKVYESLVLDYNGHDLFLLHGHQADFWNSTFIKVSYFLVRHVWKYLEHFSFKDPTSAAKNQTISKNTEKKLENWSKEENKITIAGHTHKAVFPNVGSGLYFNDGSCIHPNGITALEIENGKITLVRWSINIKDDDELYVAREEISKSIPIIEYYKKNNET